LTKKIFLIDKPSFRDIFDPNMTIYAVARAKVEYGSHLGIIKQTKERVLHCQPIAPGDYPFSHALWGLDLNVAPDDTVSLAVKSIKRLGDSSDSPGKIIFGEFIKSSPVTLEVFKKRNEKLSVTPGFGRTALKIGPDIGGVTLSFERYQNVTEAPVAIGQHIANKFISPNSVKKSKSRGGAGSE